MNARAPRPELGSFARSARGARLRAVVMRVGGLCAVLVTVTGCSMAMRAARMYYDATPMGTEQREWGLRRTMASGAFETALDHVSDRDEAAPRDRLLRSLYDGIVAYYAGDHARSGKSLRAADDLAEERFTRSVSRGALSLVSNDMVLPYMPGHTERLLVHYYAALGYLHRDDLNGAAVEARRLSQLLQQFDDSRDPADRSARAFLRYFAGAVFEAAGERNDADVAYRNAVALGVSQALPLPASVPAGSGEVIVLFERGFVAQRVEEHLHIEIAETERDSLTKSKGTRDLPAPDVVISRMMRQLEESSESGVYRASGGRHLRRDREHGDLSDDLLLKVAWPVFLPPLRESRVATVVLADNRTASFTLVGDISEGIVADYRRQRPMLLARTVARAAIKLAAAEAAEKKKGSGARTLATLAGAVLEHADTRSWHLLPADVALARLTLPAGRHRLTIRLGDPGVSAERVVELGEVEVEAGGITFVSGRAWPTMTAYGVDDRD